MVTYNYDRDNAEKFYEYMKYQRATLTLGKYPTCFPQIKRVLSLYP